VTKGVLSEAFNPKQASTKIQVKVPLNKLVSTVFLWDVIAK